MPENLVRQNAIAKPSAIALPPSRKILAVELVLTAQNSKVSLSEELQSEFVREFERESPELIERVFRAWRRRSKFMPTIAEIFDLLEEEAVARYQEREAERQAGLKAEAERARESWQDPKQQAELKLIIADLGKRLTLVRMNDLARLDPARSPRNVIALSQSAVLGKLGPQIPKKSPKPLPAEAGIAPKRAEKVAGQLARQR
jgi:hypothetical protein